MVKFKIGREVCGICGKPHDLSRPTCPGLLWPVRPRPAA